MGRRRQACPSCGQPIPGESSFCANCGAPLSGVILEPAEQVDGDSEVVLAGGGGGRWRSVIIGGGVAAALVAAVVFVGTNNNGGTSAPTTVPTTVPPPTTASTAPSTTTAMLPAFQAGSGPVLAPSTTGTLWAIVHRDGGATDVVTIDMATGDVRRQPFEFAVSGESSLVATAAGALVVSGTDRSWVNLDLVATDVTHPPAVDVAMASPLADEAWGQMYSSGSDPLLVHLRPSTGETLATIPVPEYTSLVGVDPAGGPVVTSIGGSYVLDPDTAAWRRLSNSLVHAVDHGLVVEHACDDAFQCVDQVRDLATGDQHVLEDTGGPPYFMGMAVAPVGGAVAAAAPTGGSSLVRVVVWDGEGHVLAERENVNVAGPFAYIAFTPDGAYVIYVERGELRLISVDGPAGISPAAAERRLNDMLGGGVAVAAVASTA